MDYLIIKNMDFINSLKIENAIEIFNAHIRIFNNYRIIIIVCKIHQLAML
jgi:hypothetical protein